MTLSIDKKSKNLYIYASLMFDKLESASGFRGCMFRGAQGYRPPLHYAPELIHLIIFITLKLCHYDHRLITIQFEHYIWFFQDLGVFLTQ